MMFESVCTSVNSHYFILISSDYFCHLTYLKEELSKSKLSFLLYYTYVYKNIIAAINVKLFELKYV